MARKLLKKLIDLIVDRPKIDDITPIPGEHIKVDPPTPVIPYPVKPQPIDPPKPVKPPVVEK